MQGCRRNFWRSFSIIAAIFPIAAALPVFAETPGKSSVIRYSNSRLLELRFSLSEQGGRETRIELWYTTDRAATWRRWTSVRTVSMLEDVRNEAKDESGRRSIRFLADADGLYGFFVVLHNAAGASSADPDQGTAAQQWVWVDETPPAVQSLAARRESDAEGKQAIRIDWEAKDQHFPDRPVSIHYRANGDPAFRLIAESLPARGGILRPLPEARLESIEIKLTARDLAGNHATRVVEVGATPEPDQTADINHRHDDLNGPAISSDGPHTSKSTGIEPVAANSEPGRARTASNAPHENAALTSIKPHDEPDAAPPSHGAPLNDEAVRKYRDGTWHRLRGETELALARFRQALEIEPTYEEARHDLAALLLVEGRDQDAVAELSRLLKQNPRNRAALKTLALAASRQKNYRTASESLQKLLLLDPNDGEAWLYYGDVILFSGDRRGAREAWCRVDAISSASEEMKDRARRRLELYPEAAAGK